MLRHAKHTLVVHSCTAGAILLLEMVVKSVATRKLAPLPSVDEFFRLTIRSFTLDTAFRWADMFSAYMTTAFLKIIKTILSQICSGA